MTIESGSKEPSGEKEECGGGEIIANGGALRFISVNAPLMMIASSQGSTGESPTRGE
jgi:hypothetical protein